MGPAEENTPRARGRRRHTRQGLLAFSAGWGGRRRGAGRKPKGEKAGVSHKKKPALSARHAVLT